MKIINQRTQKHRTQKHRRDIYNREQIWWNDINTGKSILIEVDSNGLVQQSKIYSIIETIDGVNSIDTI